MIRRIALQYVRYARKSGFWIEEEDWVQEACMAACRSIRRGYDERRGSFSTWMARPIRWHLGQMLVALHHACREGQRRTRPDSHFSHSLSSEQSFLEQMLPANNEDEPVVSECQRREDVERFERALSLIPAVEREVIRRRLMGFSVRQIAEDLDTSRITIGQRSTRGKQRLTKLLTRRAN